MVYLHPDLQGKEFNFHEITMVGHKIPNFPRSEVSLRTRATRDLYVDLPFASAPMDTVTEYRLARMIELKGGIGVIHYNFHTPDDQVEQVRRVKGYKANFVRNPICLGPNNTVADVYQMNAVRGFFSVPITEDGTPNTRIIGFVSYYNVRYREDEPERRLQDGVMTPFDKLETARVCVAGKGDVMTDDETAAAYDMMKHRNADMLIVVDSELRPCALVTDRDMRLKKRYPHASVDSNGQLLGFAAVRGDWHDPEKKREEIERIEKLAEAGVDCLIVDQGIVYGSQPEIVRYIKTYFPHIQTGAGNVDCGAMIEDLLGAAGQFIDLIKGGVGPGGACITQQELGVGRVQPSNIYECAETIRRLQNKYGPISFWGDGGARNSADITKMLAVGANVVMMGEMFAGFEESPSPPEIKSGHLWKKYRGMGSIEAMEAGGEARYVLGAEKIRVPEGFVKQVGFLGPGEQIIDVIAESVKQSMNKQGFRTIDGLQADGKEGCWIYPYSQRE